ncbi:tetratricopeptide repeat protein [Hartmannibacter diazotrophicus]|uniref:tetratricopeptide repeat protein n=1 Tax=Hartmannibacter diazotrophicus TaxID=1482074 RepID=UPI001FECA6CB|nr:tetratricopeptide repeat protein [Hartmannibacter diazotrophicus]
MKSTVANVNLPDLKSEARIDQAFRDGTRAYFSGDKQAAVDGLKFAAEYGHPAAQWKLGRMYAEGDGVTENDLQAFDYFNQIVAAHADDSPTSPQAPYVANAFVEIGNYYRHGIPNSTIQQNGRRAREIMTYAASYFGDADAQVELANMYLAGEGGDRDPRQAARWLMLAAKKGQVDAQAKLGQLLLSGDGLPASPIHGLMWLTVALKRAQTLGYDVSKIREMQENAFSFANETVRRAAISLANSWLTENKTVVAAADH